jgi:CRISPR-associated endonuclease/helicase Cas3
MRLVQGKDPCRTKGPLQKGLGVKDDGDDGGHCATEGGGSTCKVICATSGLSTEAWMNDANYRDWFQRIAGKPPHEWQRQLGEDAVVRDRMIRIPTGFGKTAGVVLAWLWHRVQKKNEAWPRRLVFCLPMRVLVEQTEGAIRAWLNTAGADDVRLHVLMGGVDAQRWVERPDKSAILVGTQDMLLSRALNRGYATGRALWPMEFGLLHQDALWVFDEVQLMDVGLATSAQLAAFRDDDRTRRAGGLRPVHTWWMSATLQPRWLKTVDRPEPSEPALSIPASQRRGDLFEVKKRLVRSRDIETADDVATCARTRHAPRTLTLIVVNRVKTAIDVYDALAGGFSEGKGQAKRPRQGAPELRLVHSRFRGVERSRWAADFLRKDAEMPDAGRIVVATQVVEAGVDISATTLVTELAPWSSLVQRFGRAARYGGSGDVIVVGAVAADDTAAAPYPASQLAAADEGIALLLAKEADASPRSLEAFEEDLARTAPDFLRRLYPYEPLHLLRRRDLDDLFDTSADLSGSDLDVSRYIRSGDARDVTVFWRTIEAKADRIDLEEPPRREELCPVPIGDIRAWKSRAFVFDYLDGEWVPRDAKHLAPGMTVLLDASDGGYTVERGWDGKTKSLDPVPLASEAADGLVRASSIEDGDDLSAAPWKTIAMHGRETEEQARLLCAELGIASDLARIIGLAGRWHDVGKVHNAFQDAITRAGRDGAPSGDRRDWAKAPRDAWRRPPYPERPGFRHELASTLALFELLRRSQPLHPALLGPHKDLFEAMGTPIDAPSSRLEHPLADEIAALSAHDFNLLAWLVCTHHGTVRCVWTSTPRDQENGHGDIHGVRDGDEIRAFQFRSNDGSIVTVPVLKLSLAAAEMGVGQRYGSSWGERVASLRSEHGPFTLAFLEAILRVADWRASALATEDPLA